MTDGDSLGGSHFQLDSILLVRIYKFANNQKIQTHSKIWKVPSQISFVTRLLRVTYTMLNHFLQPNQREKAPE